MEIKQIEKIAKAYKKIEVLHKDIITLNKLAETVLQSEKGASLKLSVDKIKEQKKEGILDSDGSLKTSSNNEHTFVGFNVLLSYDYGDVKLKNDDSKININLELDDLLSLEVIGVLISKKDKELKQLLNSIK